MKYKIYIVSHTHWDREWYHLFEVYRIRLVEIMEELFKILSTDKKFNSFTLDGQAIIIEDYLEIMPENFSKIMKYVKKGRLIIGPWFTQLDEFLVSGESIIRNLMFGIRLSKKIGRCMNIGYLPDTFGHISQLPQILQGFNIDAVVIGRGIQNKRFKTELWWKSISNHKVLTVFLPLGYNNACNLTADIEAGNIKLKNVINSLKKRSNLNLLLLMNGVDHSFPERKLSSIIDKLNSTDERCSFLHRNLITYFADLKKEIKKKNLKLQTITGELYEIDSSPSLKNVLSSRIYLKQLNYYSQYLIERIIEPFIAFLFIYNENVTVEKKILFHIWKSLLKNHSHDSICGCSNDFVHREMVTRFENIIQTSISLKQKLGEKIGNVIFNNNINSNVISLLIFNPLNWQRNEIIEMSIEMPGENYKLYNHYNKEIEYKIIQRDKSVCFKSFKYDLPYWYKTNRYKIRFYAPTIPGPGFVVYKLKKCKKKYIPIKKYEVKKSLKLRTSSLKIDIKSNGSFSVVFNNHHFKNLNLFISEADAGTEYVYIKPKFDSIYTTKKLNGTLVIEDKTEDYIIVSSQLNFYLPESLTGNRLQRKQKMIKNKILTRMKIYYSIPRIDIETEIENNSKDHRLQVLFPTNLNTDKIFIDTHFGINCYNIKKCFNERFKLNFVSLNDATAGITISSNGLYEFKITKEKVIHLTLLRCIGILGEGIEIPLHDSQCIGRWKFNYSLIFHTGNFLKSRSYQLAYNHYYPLNVTPLNSKDLDIIDNNFKIIEIKNTEVILSSIKIAENNKSIIIRLYNISNKNISVQIDILVKGIKKIVECNLNERNVKKLRFHNNKIIAIFLPYEIKTLKLYRKEK